MSNVFQQTVSFIAEGVTRPVKALYLWGSVGEPKWLAAQILNQLSWGCVKLLNIGRGSAMRVPCPRSDDKWKISCLSTADTRQRGAGIQFQRLVKARGFSYAIWWKQCTRDRWLWNSKGITDSRRDYFHTSKRSRQVHGNLSVLRDGFIPKLEWR